MLEATHAAKGHIKRVRAEGSQAGSCLLALPSGSFLLRRSALRCLKFILPFRIGSFGQSHYFADVNICTSGKLLQHARPAAIA